MFSRVPGSLGYTAAAMLPKQARETFRKHITKPSGEVSAPPSRSKATSVAFLSIPSDLIRKQGDQGANKWVIKEEQKIVDTIIQYVVGHRPSMHTDVSISQVFFVRTVSSTHRV